MVLTWLALAEKGYNLQVNYSGKWLHIGSDEYCVKSAVCQGLKIRYKHEFQNAQKHC
jgi:hypothetical protein